ncbi:MAG: sigma-54-dependent Fis family transcriptional regulator [Bryobacterales bacterium]|nr:sigma-54-dependent Fis family transcriptional regulator [Bryobacterales bacterium]
MEHLLLVDDDPGFRKLSETILAGEGHHVTSAASVKDALAAAARREFSLVLCDLRLPDGDGLDVLRWFRANEPATPVIMITGFATVNNAVEAMKLGAADYLGKPLSSPDQLRLLVRRLLAARQADAEREVLREEQSDRFSCGDLIAEAPRMRRVLDLVSRVAPTNATVLVLGESGTGKEIIARCIHAHSQRSKNVFVAVNCAALSPTLIESELFGHEKGAFTGATGQHIGRFERAHHGTLFLDEIGELDANLQAKLLRVLQGRTFERVGGNREITVDVRVIAATNRDLQQAVAAGRFREDLYYRLNLFPVELPPLRDRGQDIVALARFFLARAGRSLHKQAPHLTPEVEQHLMAYNWPGNVRELENLMERLAILSDGNIDLYDLPRTAAAAGAAAHPASMKDLERSAIEQALAAHHGNRTHAARQLGISLRTLQYRLKEYGIHNE